MSTNETRSQDSITIIIAGDDVKVIDNTPGWEGPFAEYSRYGESIGHDYARRPVCGAEVLDDEVPTASHRSTYRYEQSVLQACARLKTFRRCILAS